MPEEPVRVILWGTGKEYQRLREQIRRDCGAGKLRVEAVTTSEPPSGQSEFDGYPLIRPSEIPGRSYDRILICNRRNVDEISESACAVEGVDRGRLIPGWLLRDGVSVEDYLRLEELRVSILSNNCWGGIMSHTLGLEHRSPTKNLFFMEDDYLKILKAPEHYLLESDPVFCGWMPGGDEGQERYPVLKIDDVRIFCNHDLEPEAAAAKWLRRREKLDLDETFLSFSPRTREQEKVFCELDRYPKKICFVPWEPQYPVSVRPAALPGEERWSQTIMRTAQLWHAFEYYSPVRLILTGQHYGSAGAGKEEA